ncbi:universal stress protein [Leifsonia shinshuensis]|uniref:universal stress protein n=1 Tax=Leifsonia shinshuensis TaxID=150026 RepID=UPI001F5153F2|nr:universal stress protein [Leifsonia shinshuensis]MCI0155431.1 universal stress protein [Leifsonia shinshuensis]
MSHPRPDEPADTAAPANATAHGSHPPLPDAGPVIVGVHLGQPIDVLLHAARLAVELDRDLVCAYVAADVVSTGWDRPEHFEVTVDFEDGSSEEDLAPELIAAIRAALDAIQAAPTWSIRVLSGDVADELAELAHETEARLLVVGGRRRGFDRVLDHITSGSVSSRLAHDQLRPLLVVPDPGHHRGLDRGLLELPAAVAAQKEALPLPITPAAE